MPAVALGEEGAELAGLPAVALGEEGAEAGTSTTVESTLESVGGVGRGACRKNPTAIAIRTANARNIATIGHRRLVGSGSISIES